MILGEECQASPAISGEAVNLPDREARLGRGAGAVIGAPSLTER